MADLAKYLKVGGMFELKDGQDYSMYENINLNPFTWKDYNVEGSLRGNGNGMLEIVLNTSDAVLLGTDQSLMKQPEVITRYRVTLDNELL